MVFKTFARICCNRPSRITNFYYSIRPIFTFSRCFGLSPFSIQTNLFGEAQHVNVTFFDLAWFGISIVVYGCSGMFAMTLPIPQIFIETVYVLTLGDQILLCFGLLSCIVGSVLDMINRNRILRSIQRFEAFDKEVKAYLLTIIWKDWRNQIFYSKFRCVLMVFPWTILFKENE